eukprot:scaffold26379_cov58-Phaeocystis_antarctica.AAC.1
MAHGEHQHQATRGGQGNGGGRGGVGEVRRVVDVQRGVGEVERAQDEPHTRVCRRGAQQPPALTAGGWRAGGTVAQRAARRGARLVARAAHAHRPHAVGQRLARRARAARQHHLARATQPGGMPPARRRRRAAPHQCAGGELRPPHAPRRRVRGAERPEVRQHAAQRAWTLAVTVCSRACGHRPARRPTHRRPLPSVTATSHCWRADSAEDEDVPAHRAHRVAVARRGRLADGGGSDPRLARGVEEVQVAVDTRLLPTPVAATEDGDQPQPAAEQARRMA